MTNVSGTRSFSLKLGRRSSSESHSKKSPDDTDKTSGISFAGEQKPASLAGENKLS